MDLSKIEEKDDDIALKELEYKAQIETAKAKRAEADSGVKKVIYGTMIVGVAASMFPFFSSFAEQITARSTAKLEISLAKQKIKIEDAKSSRLYLEGLAKEARSEDLQTRIILADFYKHLAPTSDERTRWSEFQVFLTKKQNEITQQKVLDAKIDPKDHLKIDAIASKLKLEAFQRYELPSSVTGYRGTRVFSEEILKLQFIMSDKGCRVRVDGLAGRETVKCVVELIRLDEDEVINALSYHEGPSLLGSILLGESSVPPQELGAYLNKNGKRRNSKSHYFRFLNQFFR